MSTLPLQISQGLSFSEAFWDDQFKGVDILSDKLKRSKATTEEVKQLYQSRAAIEQEYGQKLLALAASSQIGKKEYGSFSDTLSCIPSTLEATAHAHIDLAQQLKDHLELPLNGFLQEQKDTRKKQHVQIENLRQLKLLNQSEMLRTKEAYSNECNTLVQLEKNLTSETRKEFEIQRQKAVVAEQVYKRAVDNYNDINDRWAQEWRQATDAYQQMEINRMAYIRNTLWSFSNMMATALNVDEESCDRIRTALETTDIEKDITSFVRSQGTGLKTTKHVPYETFYTPPASKDSTSPVSEDYLPQSVTVLTNPDEELKSVDRQLKQLERIQTPRYDEFSPFSPTNHQSAHESIQSLPPIITDSNRPLSLSDDYSLSLLGLKEPQKKSQGVHSSKILDHEHSTYQPNTKLDVEEFRSTAFPSPPMPDSPPEEEEEEDAKILRAPPKDEKWVISSLRKSHTDPIRVDPEHVHVPKAHKPAVPLTIEIPNGPGIQKTAHQVIEDARRQSQMSPVHIDRPQSKQEIPQNSIRTTSYDHPNERAFATFPPSIRSAPLTTQPEQDTKKESKTKPVKGNRFSHFFGNKKEKKKQQLKQPIQEEQDTTEPKKSLQDIKYVAYAKSQWPFEATVKGEMSVNQNEPLGIIFKQMDGWWQAERLSGPEAGKKGLVPGNYMTEASH
ncbi:hypothetical protein BY458DRAFT_502062 [Sporodiniella umbellata]|nr:hypothetical protein BY458DRAFT_502062 [Sporodiniella umbellata]